MNLGSLLDEAKRIADDLRVSKFLEDLMEFEKDWVYNYKNEIKDLLSKYRESPKQ